MGDERLGGCRHVMVAQVGSWIKTFWSPESVILPVKVLPSADVLPEIYADILVV